MCLRGSQKQSRAREQRWSHSSAQDNTTMMGWLGGRRLERGSVHSPPLAQLWRPTKFFILCLRVSGSELSELLLSCAQSVHWENLGVPYLVKPENPLWKTCATSTLRDDRCLGVHVFYCTYLVFFVFAPSVYLGSLLYLTEILFFQYFSQGRCGCRSPVCSQKCFFLHFSMSMG